MPALSPESGLLVTSRLGSAPFLHHLRLGMGLPGLSPGADLFGGFLGTTSRYDSPRRASQACGFRLPWASQPLIRRPGVHGASRFSGAEIPNMPGSPTPRGPLMARANAIRDVAFRVFDHVGTP